jgi:protein gp37
MAEKTDISWTDATINFWWGCSKISKGCLNCYAEGDNKRYKKAQWGLNTQRTWMKGAAKLAAKINRKAAKMGKELKAFSSSMSDFFETHSTGVLETYREEAWKVIKRNRNIRWLILTKRADNIKKMLPVDWESGNWKHVSLGCTVEHEDYVDRLDYLRDIKDWGGFRFVSYEPALSRIDHVVNLKGISWLIYGGESSRSLKGFRRDCDDWARGIRDKCEAEGVAFFYKQNSGIKSRLIDTLDGVEYKRYPLI